MKPLKLRDRIRYAFDNTMARGAGALMGWLALITLVVIGTMAAILTLFQIGPSGGSPPEFQEGIWQNLMRTLDAGNMASDEGWVFRIIMLLVTIGGIFVFSSLIGVISNSINVQMEELRKGRSFVIEKNHTLILGWSSKIFTIISELSIANSNTHKPRIIILAEKDKVEMEDEIRRQVPNLRKTKIICRSGNPCDLNDLHIANPYDSRSIIVLNNESENGDSETIKTILALTNNPNRRPEPYHIIAEMKDHSNMEVAKMVAKDEIEIILSDELVARIMVQTSRQSGLSGVYVELLDFDGVEIYFTEEKSLVGKSFGEALMAYEDSALIGLFKNKTGVLINPPSETLIDSGDKIIAISEDDDTLKLSGRKPQVQEEHIRDLPPQTPKTERTLLLGWNKRAPAILRELNSYVAEGSILQIVSRLEVPDKQQDLIQDGLDNLRISYELNDTSARAVLDSLNVESYDHILLLCYDDIELQEADSITLITLLHLRDISEKKEVDLSIVSEMYDIRNRELAEVTKADDFIVSDKLISLVLSQVSENKQLMRVFEYLFDAEGSEIYLKPAEQFIAVDAEINFYTVVESARRKGQVAIGYRIAAQSSDPKNAYGVKVNPKKSEKVKFAAGDKIILLAEN